MITSTFFSQMGGGGLALFPDFWFSDVNIMFTPHYIG